MKLSAGFGVAIIWLASGLLSPFFSNAQDSTDAAASNEKKYPSKFWKITGNGLTQPSYLYGTMHVSSKVAFHLSDSVFIGIEECDMVALETNPQEWLPDMMTSKLMRQSRILSSSRGASTYGFYESAFELPVPDNDGLAAALRYEHSMVNPMLFRGSGYNQEFEEQTYLDMFIYQAGAKQGKLMMNLESFEESQRLGIEANIPDPDEKPKRRSYSSYSRDGKSIFEQIEDAYRKGDLDVLDSLQKLTSPSKKYFDLFLVQRNRNMVDKMDSLMKLHSVFSAIGAAHLAGDEGAIEMLREKGYTVRPIHSEITSKGRKTWKKIKKKTVPLDYNVQFVADDSMFKLMAPGKMYETQGGGHSKEYIFPDMTNGAYFSVARMNNYSILNGQSVDELMEKMDSLFFENIPGEIHDKKRIEKDGYPGFDILNETRTGDYQRYQIFFTPLEIYIFKMGGVGKFVKKESSKFFGTINFLKKKEAWKNRKYTGGGFQVSLPTIGDHKGMASSELTYSTQHEVIQSYDSKTNSYYLILQRQLIDDDLIEDDTFELRQLIIGFGKQLDYKLKNGLKFIKHEGYPAAQATLEHDDYGSLVARCVLRNNSFYLLICKGKNEDKFFNSFKFIPYQYNEPFFNQKDTFGNYTITTTELPDPIFKRGQKSYRYRSYYSSDDREKDISYQSESDNSSFVNRTTGEVVSMYFYRYHKYSSTDSLEGYWKHYIDGYLDADDRGMYIKEKKTGKGSQEDVYTMDLTIADTFSIREIYVSKILRNGAVYSLMAFGDSLTPKSEFVSTIFKTFKPVDSVIGKPLLESKTDLFFEDLWSDDSTRRAQALRSINVVDFEDEDAPRIIKVIDEFKFIESDDKKLDEKEYREDFIQRLAFRDHESVPPYFKKLYQENSDESSIQFLALEGLADFKTEESFKILAEIAVEEPPLTEGSEISDIFRSFYDTLEIAPVLFPKLLELTEFDEYESSVYNLLAMLVDSSLIKASVYENPYKTKVLRLAKNEIKRKLNTEESKSSSSISRRSLSSYYGRKTYSRDEIENYASLLLPFSNDSKVKSVLEDYWKIEDKNQRTDIALLYLENKMEVPDSIINDIASDYKYIGNLYDGLKKLDLTSKLDTPNLTQFNIARGELFFNYDEENEDTFEFVETRNFKVGDSAAVMYLFKGKTKYSSEYKLQYVVYLTEDTNQVTTRVFYKSTNLDAKVEEKKVIDKKMKELITWFQIKDHKRVRNPGRSSYESAWDFGL